MPRECRFCHERTRPRDMVAPCACAGTVRWVHTDCLDRWRKVSHDRATVCGMCKTPYATERETARWHWRRWTRVLLVESIAATISMPFIALVNTAWHAMEAPLYRANGVSGVLLSMIAVTIMWAPEGYTRAWALRSALRSAACVAATLVLPQRALALFRGVGLFVTLWTLARAAAAVLIITLTGVSAALAPPTVLPRAVTRPRVRAR